MLSKFEGDIAEITQKMAAGNAEYVAWLLPASFAQTTTGHVLAWREDEPGTAAVWSSAIPEGAPCEWAHSCDHESIESLATYVESGEFDKEEPQY